MAPLVEWEMPPVVSILVLIAILISVMIDILIMLQKRHNLEKTRVFSAFPVSFDVLCCAEALAAGVASLILFVIGFTRHIYWLVVLPGLWHNVCVVVRCPATPARCILTCVAKGVHWYNIHPTSRG